MNGNPLVSVLTPTWNRAKYLRRVWEGLCGQTYKYFEWIVANDGSTDETEATLRDLAARSNFPIIIINASVHIGKARMDNEAIAQAHGEFILWNDSDDYLLPSAIERLVASWNSISKSKQDEYVGVTALCAAGTEILTPLPPIIPLDTTWNDLAGIHHINGDMIFFTRTRRLKENPFPEVDFVIPEGVIWSTIGNEKTRLLQEVLKVVEYRTPNSISFSGKMEYCRGRAYALAISVRNLQYYPRSLKSRLWELVTYIRYSLHGEISLRSQMRMWGDNSSSSLFLLLWPMGCLFALKDQLQRKVRKTHREFLAATLSVKITYVRLGVNQ